MILFAVSGFLLLGLIFFVVRSQSLQAQVNQMKQYHRMSDQQKREAMNYLVSNAEELQKCYLDKLELAHRAGLLNQERYEKSHLLIRHYAFVTSLCVDKQISVQEAMKKVSAKSGVGLGDIQQFIALQAPNIRSAWSTNQLKGYMSVCHQLASVNDEALAQAS